MGGGRQGMDINAFSNNILTPDIPDKKLHKGCLIYEEGRPYKTILLWDYLQFESFCHHLEAS